MFKNNSSEETLSATGNRALLTIVAPAVICALIVFLWIGVLAPEIKTLDEYKLRIDDEEGKIRICERTVRRAPDADRVIPKLTGQIQVAEATMPQRVLTDSKRWFLDKISSPSRNYNLALTFVDQDFLPLPKDVFGTATYSIQLESSYLELARFLDDIEKTIPYSLVKNLTVRSQTETREPNVAPAKDDAEKLNVSRVLVLAFKR